MTVTLPRVFISSLMQGYGDIRNAAAAAAERAGYEPVRAENFPAATTSPRTACLDGVASSNAVVFLLGSRYIAPGGTLAPSGLSATHEEYNEAVRLKKQSFVFLDYRQDEPTDPQQQAFLTQVTGYVEGHWRKSFRSLDELGQLLETALWEAKPLIASSSAGGGAAMRLNTAFNAGPPHDDSIVWVQIAWTTLRDEEVIDPLLLMDKNYQRKIQTLAHCGDAPLLSFDLAKQTTAGASRLRISQGDVHKWREARDLVIIDLYENGTLAVAINVTGLEPDDARGNHLARMYHIDPEHVQRRLIQAWGFAARWWEETDPFLRHGLLEYNAGLRDIGRRKLEKPAPQYGGSYSVTVPSVQPHDPLWAYDRPRRIARRDLTSPASDLDRITRMLGQRFVEGRGW